MRMLARLILACAIAFAAPVAHANAKQPARGARAEGVKSAQKPVLPPVETEGGFEAPEELARALDRMRIPEDARFALNYITFDGQTNDRWSLRYDPRLPEGSRWSVADAPQSADLERAVNRVNKSMSRIRNPDALLLDAPGPDSMVFNALISETEDEAVYGFTLKPRSPTDRKPNDRFVGRLTIDRATGLPVDVTIENDGVMRAGIARIDEAIIRYTLSPVEGCCVALIREERTVRGSSLFVPSETTSEIILEDVEYVPDAPPLERDESPKTASR
jgi:hypothetical protein